MEILFNPHPTKQAGWYLASKDTVRWLFPKSKFIYLSDLIEILNIGKRSYNGIPMSQFNLGNIGSLFALSVLSALREKCPANTEFYCSVFTPYLSVFSPNAWKHGAERTPYLDTFHAVAFAVIVY